MAALVLERFFEIRPASGMRVRQLTRHSPNSTPTGRASSESVMVQHSALAGITHAACAFTVCLDQNPWVDVVTIVVDDMQKPQLECAWQRTILAMRILARWF